jgi:hypothetical protein
MAALSANHDPQIWERDMRDIGERDKCPGRNVPRYWDGGRDISGTSPLAERTPPHRGGSAMSRMSRSCPNALIMHFR